MGTQNENPNFCNYQVEYLAKTFDPKAPHETVGRCDLTCPNRESCIKEGEDRLAQELIGHLGIVFRGSDSGSCSKGK